MADHSGNTTVNQRFYWGLSYASGYFHLGMLAEAKKELVELGASYQNEPEVMSLNGLILLAKKNWDAVVEQSLQARNMYPHSPDFYIQAAYAYDKLNEPAKAKDIWLHAPDEVRTSPLYHYNIARCEARLGNLETARQHIRTALILDPKIFKTIHKDPSLKTLLPENTCADSY